MAEEIELDDPRAFEDPAVSESVVVPGLAPPLVPDELPGVWQQKPEQVAKTDAYDPNEKIILPDPTVFDDLLRPHPPTAAEAQPSQADFGLMKEEWVAPGFARFDQTARPRVEGEFAFGVEQDQLKEALETVELTVSKNPHFNKVKVTLFRTRLRLQTHNQACFAFSEYLVPLAGHNLFLSTEPDTDPLVAFVFSHARLLKIVRRFPEAMAVVGFTYVAATNVLAFQTWEDPNNHTVVQKDFRLTCSSLSSFPDYHTHNRLANPTLVGKLNPVRLRQAVRYARVFARQDDTRGNLNLIELRAGVMYSGTTQNMGAMAAAALQGLALKVRFESVKPLEQILARFNRDDTSMFQTDGYTILTDEVVTFGFERYDAFAFPDVKDWFHNQESDNHVLVPRNQLSASLALLAAVRKDSRLLVEVSLTGYGSEIRLNLLTREHTGQPCHDFVRVSRRDNPGRTMSEVPDWHFSVDLEVWLDLVQHFESTNVHLEVFNNQALYVYDDNAGDGKCAARSLLSFLTQAQADKLKAQEIRAATGRVVLHKEFNRS